MQVSFVLFFLWYTKYIFLLEPRNKMPEPRNAILPKNNTKLELQWNFHALQ